MHRDRGLSAAAEAPRADLPVWLDAEGEHFRRNDADVARVQAAGKAAAARARDLATAEGKERGLAATRAAEESAMAASKTTELAYRKAATALAGLVLVVFLLAALD